ncbi:acetylcholine receptor subunit delta-like [Mercenaria mercenaria]|uniref:acetylcholine receptor subunit delta-like n=1 Tax=Mercenaria mercenaria TaxID=6596 RepID=UPI00234EE2CF|nr:acetylcholine receptor subunit delta-like [Mercenaria mercenaria]
MVTSLFLMLCSLSQSTALAHHRNEYSVPKVKEIKKLSDRLLSNYSKHILPFEGPWPFVIDIHVYLVAVGDIDEIDQKLSTVMGLEYEDSIIYDSKGLAFFDEMMITRTTCNLDMSFYPFDVHTCDIKLSIVGNSKFHFHLKTSWKDLISHSVSEHGPWRLIEASKSSFYGTLKIVMTFERKSLFIMLHILLPIISIAILTPTVFVLPKKSGERLGFSVTMLLAVSVYTTIVSYHLPQKAESLPLILILVCIWYVMDAVIVFIVILNTKIYKLKNDGFLPYECEKVRAHYTRNNLP